LSGPQNGTLSRGKAPGAAGFFPADKATETGLCVVLPGLAWYCPVLPGFALRLHPRPMALYSKAFLMRMEFGI